MTPGTSTTDDVLEGSRGWLYQEIGEAIEQNKPGFRNGWVSSVRVGEMLGTRRASQRAINEALDALGYHRCKLWAKGRACALIQEGGVRPVLYCTDAVDAFATSVQDYLTAQGYS